MRILIAGLLLGALALPALAQSPQPPTQAPPARPAPSPPRGAAPHTPAQHAPAASATDLNLATPEELQLLPGIGPARAAAIVTHRPYRSVDEVTSKGAVPISVADGFRARVTATQINVNAATKREMVSTLPGIGDSRADAIIRGRPYARPEELVSKGGVPQAVFERIRHAVTLQ
ncbi:ComEA family DNA-binding protein [Muricoccus vinaceus]|uniref:ComEA family DNA-binding protein n=1 Tax=Muricoccus vinaceus TaxID=424704 RepID=A0ABV6IMT1_9PROT